MSLNPKCGRNHYLRDCPKTSNQEKATIFAATKDKWKAEAEAQKTKQAKQAKATAKQVAGQAHMQVSIEDVEGLQGHQDDYLYALAFIQASDGHNAVQQHKQRKTLKPTYLYLDSMSSFYQVFWKSIWKK